MKIPHSLPKVSFEITDEKKKIFESKVGGLGYIPHDGDFPKTKEGSQLRLLAQVDCSELGGLENFPKQGLLQFWVENDDVFGLDFDDPTNQDTFRIIYYPEVDRTVTEEEVKSKFVENQYDSDEYSMPVFGEFGMKFAAAGRDDFFEFVDEEPDEEYEDELYDNSCGHKLGGLPYFTQSDPREGDEELMKKYDTLLFQLDTDSTDSTNDAIMWGDSGIGNFFINSEKLKALDFSDVLYNWDCC